jgi:hypothetical protein
MIACGLCANQSYRNRFLRYSVEKSMIPIMSAGRAGHLKCERMAETILTRILLAVWM